MKEFMKIDLRAYEQSIRDHYYRYGRDFSTDYESFWQGMIQSDYINWGKSFGKTSFVNNCMAEINGHDLFIEVLEDVTEPERRITIAISHSKELIDNVKSLTVGTTLHRQNAFINDLHEVNEALRNEELHIIKITYSRSYHDDTEWVEAIVSEVKNVFATLQVTI